MSKQTSTFDAERYLDAATSATGLVITSAQRPGVIRYLQIAQDMASRLARAPVDPDVVEPAPVFTPAAIDGQHE